MGGFDVEPRRHSPHTLGQCPRKIWYREQNAPRENVSPDGVFFTGTKIEEKLVEPFLDDISQQHGMYVQNSLWVETEMETTVGTVWIKGSTDPVVCDDSGKTYVVTEVKSTKSLEYLDEPHSHHLAQLRAYQHALRNESGEVPDGLLLYVDKTTLELEVFEPAFDEDWFKSEVVEWCSELTECRLECELPPAEPHQDWECGNCEFKERCGRGTTPVGSLPAEGFLPVMKYPEQAVYEYLRAHEHSRVTPTLAAEYPHIAETVGVDDWVCRECGTTYPWGVFDWDGVLGNRPVCPSCQERGERVVLRGPLPGE